MAEQTPDSIITTQRNGQTIVAELFFNHSSTETFRDTLVSTFSRAVLTPLTSTFPCMQPLLACSWRCRADFPAPRLQAKYVPARRFLSSVPAAAPVSEAMCKNSAKKTAAAL